MIRLAVCAALAACTVTVEIEESPGARVCVGLVRCADDGAASAPAPSASGIVERLRALGK